MAIAAQQIRLPTAADVRPPDVLSLLPGHFPSRIPRAGGTIRNDEIVQIGIAPDGNVRDITVTQTITLGGVGDYTLEIAGPASDAEALDGSDAIPGLRNGAVIWEGFSSGKKVLKARVTMDVRAPRFVPLPISVSANGTRVRISNETGTTQEFRGGDVDARQLSAAVAAARAALHAGRAPVPGTQGMPVALAVSGRITSRRDLVTVPMRVHGTVAGLPIDRVLGDVPFDVPAGAGAQIHLVAEPVLPAESTIGTPSLETLLRVLWQSALSADFGGYLGTPVPSATHATYVYEPAKAAPTPRPPPAKPQRPRPVPIAIASIAVLGALAAGWRWWSMN